MTQREIKFRVWNGSTMEYNVTAGKFGTFFVNPGAKGDGLDEKDTACLTPFNTRYPDEIPVMQFTGLKDKNGKEIWEGDVVRINNLKSDFKRMETPQRFNYFRVEWNKYTFAFNNAWIYLPFGDYDTKTLEPYNLEVIGNIYENPELLNPLD